MCQPIPTDCRAKAAQHLGQPTSLPNELWLECLSHLGLQDVPGLRMVCKEIRELLPEALGSICKGKWPQAADCYVKAQDSTLDWCQFAKKMGVLDISHKATPDPRVASKLAEADLSASNRGLLVAWLCEVSLEWKLETCLVFHAVRYLDHFLAQVPLSTLGLLQLIGISCLRVAMSSCPNPVPASTPGTDPLDPKLFAEITACGYEPQDIVRMTETVSRLLAPLNLSGVLTAHDFLRGLYDKAVSTGVIPRPLRLAVEHLASFLLHLSLQSVEASLQPPSQLAAAALSVALEACQLPTWPRELQSFLPFTVVELERTRALLRQLQETAACDELRANWNDFVRSSCVDDGLTCHQDTLKALQMKLLVGRLLAAPSKIEIQC